MNRRDYIDIFDSHWESGRFNEAIEIYEFLGRIMERAKYVAEHYERV